MVLELETLGYQLVQSAGASMDVEESIAGRAMEVVVVLGGHACQFIPIASAGDAHDGDHSIFLKSADGSVDRAKSQ